MKIDRVFTRQVLATTRSATLPEAAATMSRYKVGALLVMEDEGAGRGPVGIVTDRDLALHGFASTDASVGSAMTPVVATVKQEADAHEALELMRAHGVRRLVVIGAGGAACGMVSIDDLVDGLSVDLAAAAAVLKGEIKRDSAGLGDVLVGSSK